MRASTRCCARRKWRAIWSTDDDEARDEDETDGRRDKGRKVDGWLVLDKPVGMTSTDGGGAG